MSDALYGFATGFAQGFTQTYSASVAAKREAERDKIRFGAQAWLQKEREFSEAKRRDEQLMAQAEALVSSESLIPNDAVMDVYNMLKAGRTVQMIVNDVRTAGARFEALPDPRAGSEINVVDGDVQPNEETQSQELFGEDTSLSVSGSQGSISTANPDGQNNPDTSTAPQEEPDPNNPFTQYSSQIRDAVGQQDNEDYFNQVLAGYSSPVRQNRYRFSPGVTKVDIPTLDEMLARTVYNSTEYKDAVRDNDTQAQQQIILDAIALKSGDNDLPFGTGGVAAAMTVWSQTEEGRAALDNNDADAIAEQFFKFSEVVNPSSSTTSGRASRDFNLTDLEGSFMNIWENTDEGKEALENQDFDAIAEAVAASHQEAQRVRDSINAKFGFKPEEVTRLDQIPGLRQRFSGNEVVMDQLQKIEEGLLAMNRSATESTATARDYTAYSIVDGRLQVIGTYTRRNGKTYDANGNEVPPQDAAVMFFSDITNPLDVERIGASDWMKKRDALYGSVDLAQNAVYYLASLEDEPTARTYTARFASGVGELLNELEAIKQLSTIADPAGGTERYISRDRMLEEIRTNPAFDKYSANVRSVIAQETALVFDVARAGGNSGHALSNKDYDNYFRSLFNSNDIEVVRANLERLTANSFNTAVNGAKSIAQAPGMSQAVNGNGVQWWENPEDTVLAGREAAVINFIRASQARVTQTIENSSYGSTAEQLLERFMAGETITVNQALIDAYPEYGFRIGQTLTRPPQDQDEE